MTDHTDCSNPKESICIGLSVWDSYQISLVRSICVPALLAQGNLSSLQDRYIVRLIIVVRPEYQSLLEEALFDLLKDHGLSLECIPFFDTVPDPQAMHGLGMLSFIQYCWDDCVYLGFWDCSMLVCSCTLTHFISLLSEGTENKCIFSVPYITELEPVLSYLNIDLHRPSTRLFEISAYTLCHLMIQHPHPDLKPLSTSSDVVCLTPSMGIDFLAPDHIRVVTSRPVPVMIRTTAKTRARAISSLMAHEGHLDTGFIHDVFDPNECILYATKPEDSCVHTILLSSNITRSLSLDIGINIKKSRTYHMDMIRDDALSLGTYDMLQTQLDGDGFHLYSTKPCHPNKKISMPESLMACLRLEYTDYLKKLIQENAPQHSLFLWGMGGDLRALFEQDPQFKIWTRDRCRLVDTYQAGNLFGDHPILTLTELGPMVTDYTRIILTPQSHAIRYSMYLLAQTQGIDRMYLLDPVVTYYNSAA